MPSPHRFRPARSGLLALALGALALLPWLGSTAFAQNLVAASGVHSFNSALYPDGMLRQFLVKNGRLYRRIEPQWNAWENITPLFDGALQVGIGEITAYDVEVYQDGRYRMFLTRGGQVFRITQLETGGWGAWENITAVFTGTGGAPITSFSSALYADGLLRQFLVRDGRVYRRTQQSAQAIASSEAWGAWSDITEVFANVGDPQRAIVSFHVALYADGALRQFLVRGDRLHRRTEPQWEQWDDITSVFAGVGRSPDPRVHDPIYKRAMVIEINPLIASRGHRPLHEVMGWRDPRVLEQQYVGYLEQASSQVAQYAVAQHVMVRAFPAFTDGPPFTEAEYLSCMAAQPSPNCREQRFDYARFLREHRVCEKANAGEIDELWIMGGPFFGLWEANMAGPGAFPTNGPIVEGTACAVKLNIMGFNYEREPERMLENMGHRIEGTMRNLFGQWRNGYLLRPNPFPVDANPLERFTARGFDYTTAACGNIHGSLNTPKPDPRNPWGYDFTNRNVEPNTCDDWENYPNLTGAITHTDCGKWNCADLDWHLYWLGKVPAFVGRTPGARNNWWFHVLDWDAAAR